MRAALNKAGRAGLEISAASAMPDEFDDMMFAGLSQTWMGPMDFAVDFDPLLALQPVQVFCGDNADAVATRINTGWQQTNSVLGQKH